VKCGGFRISYRSDERIFDTLVPIVALAVLLVALGFAPRFAGTYWLDVLNRIGIAIIGALGLNILVGYTGQISIGQAAFLAVGAYSTAIPSQGWPALLPGPSLAAFSRGVWPGVRRSASASGLTWPSLPWLGVHHHLRIIHWESMTNGGQGNMPPANCSAALDSDARVFYLILRWLPRAVHQEPLPPGSAGPSSPFATATRRPA
jgi:branched-chain amino acid transport system permease protein